MLYVAESSYAYDIHIKHDEAAYYSKGAVCVDLTLADGHRSDRDLLRKSGEVQTAFQRGWLDEVGKSRADFRLGIKPLMRKLAALRNSAYLPDDEWRVDVVFAHWYSQPADELELSPFGSDYDSPFSFEELEIQLREHGRRRDLRIADLFKTR